MSRHYPLTADFPWTDYERAPRHPGTYRTRPYRTGSGQVRSSPITSVAACCFYCSRHLGSVARGLDHSVSGINRPCPPTMLWQHAGLAGPRGLAALVTLCTHSPTIAEQALWPASSDRSLRGLLRQGSGRIGPRWSLWPAPPRLAGPHVVATPGADNRPVFGNELRQHAGHPGPRRQSRWPYRSQTAPPV